jgi:hypothetical protein
MSARTFLLFPIALVVLAAILFTAPLAHAESVLWNTAIQDTLCEDSHDLPGTTLTDACHVELDNPNVSISYSAHVVDADTGALIACGSTVPAGTHARFEFIPHVYTDIDWFGTGYSNDSPYGDWVNAGGPPAQVQCLQKDFVSRSLGRVGDSDVYVPLEVNPPAESIAGLAGLSCTSDGVSQTCQLNSAGTVSAVFQFSDTYGKFYARDGRMDSYWAGWPYYGECDGGNTPMYAVSSGSAYTLTVPQQQLSCPITVVAGTGPPTTPTVAATAATGSTSCTAGTPYSITMSATDPQSDNIRYGIDWNADGSVDEWIPATGYVPSGTQETASRTYALAGAKTVKVLAQDANGLSSGWATLSFSCADATNSAVGSFNGNANSNVNESTGSGSITADLSLSVVPSLVRSGDTTKVNWSAANVQSCKVTAPNGDTWSAIQSIIGGEMSSPIKAATTYTLTCLDLQGATRTKTATVQILPTFQEQ